MSDLDISVHPAVIMQVLQAMKCLTNHKCYLILLQRTRHYIHTKALS